MFTHNKAGRIIRTASIPGFHVLGYSPRDHTIRGLCVVARRRVLLHVSRLECPSP
jgi:hypothetical protein